VQDSASFFHVLPFGFVCKKNEKVFDYRTLMVGAVGATCHLTRNAVYA
jgi:hypothetical protein